MKRITAIELAILVVAGLVPLLWFKPGFMIANGDNFPIFLNAQKTLSSATNMWSLDYLGYATPNPSYLLYQLFGASLSTLGLSTGFIQILIQVLLDITAGLSMYYFARVIYPGHEWAPFFAAFFYIFNFFIMNFWFNLGFAWLYAFVPLLLGLFVSSINAAYKQDKTACYFRIFGFSLVSVVALSVASINPANVVLFILALAVMGFYLLVKNIRNLKPLILTLTKIIPVSFLVNLWWIFPMIVAFILSPQGLNTQVNVTAWNWTHYRASFLNFFWLNGTWGWLPEYVPFFSYFNNLIVMVLAFVPFTIAGAALLFKGTKSRFNAYLMLSILSFLFLATGLHEPIVSIVNGFLYDHISLMSMFREPASKFTFLIVPFLALLIGFSCSKVVTLKLNIRPIRLKLSKALLLAFIVSSLLVVCAPIFNLDQFVHTNDKSLTYEPSSSYAKIPQYWYNAANWINNQPGDGNVLLTPLDDFYQINYTWGYYGSDQLFEGFFNKPLLSTVAIDGYVTNPDTTANLRQIREAVKFNRPIEFKNLLDLLGVKYVLQRNDVDTSDLSRNLVSSSAMKVRFDELPSLKLVNTFGKLDVYVYSDAKPLINALSPAIMEQTNISISEIPVLDKTWNFNSSSNVDDWINSTLQNQSLAKNLIYGNGTHLTTVMKNSTSSWTTVNSPLIPTLNESKYTFDIEFSSPNIAELDIKIAEFDVNAHLISKVSLADFGNQNDPGTFNLTYFTDQWEFEPHNDSTHYMQLQLWNFFNKTIADNCTLHLKEVGVKGIVYSFKGDGIENVYNGLNGNWIPPAINVKSDSPSEVIVGVNSTQPFILATGQVLDRFWVATVNGKQIHPTTVYLGLKGFVINETGQFDVKIDYPPQQWFNYCLDVSGITILLMFVGVVYLQRTNIEEFLQAIRRSIKR